MVASCAPPTGDLACNPGMRADWESAGDPLIHRLALYPLSHNSQGRIFLITRENNVFKGKGTYGLLNGTVCN